MQYLVPWSSIKDHPSAETGMKFEIARWIWGEPAVGRKGAKKLPIPAAQPQGFVTTQVR